jgi:hypothetical protein
MVRFGQIGAVLILLQAGAAQTAPEPLVLVESAALNPRGGVNARPAAPVPVRAAEYSLDYARRELVPAMGGSIAVADFDRDGNPDFFVAEPGGASGLYRGDGRGGYRDITASAKLPAIRGALSATFCDFDRSGRQSLFVAGAYGIALYRNRGDGTFSDVTDRAGLSAPGGEVYTRAELADLDGDGYPDLLAAVYTDLSRPPSKPGSLFPNDFAGARVRLYRNNGHGGFTDVSAASGLSGNTGRTRGAVIADFNGDGRPDLLLLRDDKPPALYLNRGGLVFREATWEAGEDLTRHALFAGTAVDMDGDGRPDLALWSALSFRVLLNRGNAVFERDESVPLLAPLPALFGFHGLAADLDGNGSPDILGVNGDGTWRAFLNLDGGLREEPAQVRQHGAASQPALDFVTPLPGGRALLALYPDGRVMTLTPGRPRRSHAPGQRVGP